MNPESNPAQASEGAASPAASSTSSQDIIPDKDQPQTQTWTQCGHPIVAGKYLKDGVIHEIAPDVPHMAGPPAVDVYWHNRRSGRDPDQFRGVSLAAFVDVTEYLVRLGKFLDVVKGSCSVQSLNATLYSVNVIVSTAMSRKEMSRLMLEHELAPAPPPGR